MIIAISIWFNLSESGLNPGDMAGWKLMEQTLKWG